jgi:hypothetical protein
MLIGGLLKVTVHRPGQVRSVFNCERPDMVTDPLTKVPEAIQESNPTHANAKSVEYVLTAAAAHLPRFDVVHDGNRVRVAPRTVGRRIAEESAVALHHTRCQS